MFGMMQGNRVPVQTHSPHNYLTVRDSSVRGLEPDVNALAAQNNHQATIMVWNYHDKNDVKVPATPVSVKVHGLPAQKVLLTHYRIDAQHSNAYEAWKKMGSPQNPTVVQIAELEQAGQLQLLGSPEWIKTNNGEAVIKLELPRQGVSLLKMDW